MKTTVSHSQLASNIKPRMYLLGLLLGILATLYACGGGGGGGGGDAPAPTPPPATVFKVWQGSALIETDNAGDALEPKVSFGGSGNAMAVWLQSDGLHNNVMARRYTASTAQWGTVTIVDTLDVDAFAPEVAMDSSGNAMVVWSQLGAASSGDIWARRYIASSGTWGKAELLEAIDGRADQVKIAIDGNGNTMVTWMQRKDLLVTNMWSRYFNNSAGTWATTALVETLPGDTSEPRVAFSAPGKAMALWQQQEGTRCLFSSLYDAAANAWSARQPIGGCGNYGVSEPQLALQGNGNATAVWLQFDGERINIKASSYSATAGAWNTPTIILDTTTVGPASAPQVAADASGNVVTVWAQYNNLRTDIWANTFTASTGRWGTATLVETDNTGSASRPQIAMDSSGSATLVWEQFTGSSENIWTRSISAGQWGVTVLLEADNRGNAISPQIAIDTSGNAMAVWTQSDGTRFNIWANIAK